MMDDVTPYSDDIGGGGAVAEDDAGGAPDEVAALDFDTNDATTPAKPDAGLGAVGDTIC